MVERRRSSRQGRLHKFGTCFRGPMLSRALCLVSCFVVAVLKIVIILEQVSLHRVPWIMEPALLASSQSLIHFRAARHGVWAGTLQGVFRSYCYWRCMVGCSEVFGRTEGLALTIPGREKPALESTQCFVISHGYEPPCVQTGTHRQTRGVHFIIDVFLNILHFFGRLLAKLARSSTSPSVQGKASMPSSCYKAQSVCSPFP